MKSTDVDDERTMDRLPLWGVTLLFSGCLFASESPPPNNDGEEPGTLPDTGEQPSDMDSTLVEDTGAEVSDIGGVETGVTEMGSPEMGSPEMGPSDLGRQDTGAPPDPYEVVQRFPMNLGGAPQLESPAQVSMFRNGFLAGYNDTTADTVWIGWYTEDRAAPLDTRSFPAEKPDLDLAGDSNRGYAVMLNPQDQFAVLFEQDSVNPDSFEDTIFQFSTTTAGVEYFEMSIATERENAYVGEIRYYDGWHLELGALSSTYGNVAYRSGYQLATTEAIGGGAPAPDRQLLLAGISDTQYSLVDFYWDGTGWSNDAYGCGPAAPTSRLRRIVPLRGLWTLASAPTIDSTEWRMVQCANQLGTPMGTVIDRPVSTEVVADFDLADESVPFGSPIVAWIQGADVWMGTLDIDETVPSAEIVDPHQIPGATGTHVRAAFNGDRATYAVMVHDVNGAELILLKRSSD